MLDYQPETVLRRKAALTGGKRLSSTEIIETVIQTGPYSGLAPALNALAALSQAIR